MTGGRPLSIGQEALWFLYRLLPDSPMFNATVGMRVHTGVDPRLLQRAITETTRRHDMLRSAFHEGSEGPFRSVDDDRAPELVIQHLYDTDPEKVRAEATRVATRPFDLALEAPFRFQLVETAPDDAILVLTGHHVACDATSQMLIIADVLRGYAALNRGEQPSSMPVRGSFDDYAADERAWLDSDRGQAARDYWRGRCLPVPAAHGLVTDRPRPAPASAAFTSSSCEFSLRDDIGLRVNGAARASGVTPFVFLFSLFQALLAAETGDEDFLVGYVTSGRRRLAMSNVVGCFMNTLPYRATLPDGTNLTSVLRTAAGHLDEAAVHGRFPFALLPRLLGESRTDATAPLVRYLFNYLPMKHFGEIGATLDEGQKVIQMAGLPISGYRFTSQPGNYDLTLEIVHVKHLLRIKFKYRDELFDASTVEALGALYLDFLHTALENTDKVSL
jgi:hypothetical protein